ncbi:MAG: RNA 2',3'-cyclic phosphodiesterase [Planctomycetes bacterium]|nr:RNA 2',3'-cyclic phosphodiesterase [Planctomycetota bacterium]
MPKLFVAIDLPAEATAHLLRLQPPATPGMRLSEPSQMHVTLHFLGESDVRRISVALATVDAPAFKQSFAGVGQFPSAGGSTTLWAGVHASFGLLKLHAAVAAALAGEGFRPESRPYTPHLTLARCDRGFPSRVIEEFTRTHSRFSLSEVPITAFGLFSSSLVADVPVYRRERGFPLRSAVRDS